MQAKETMTRNQLEIVLASSSPRRQQLIQLLQLPVTIRPADADETPEPNWQPHEMVERLSERKAREAALMTPNDDDIKRVIVASDTIVVLDGQVLGKPKTKQDAFHMLSQLQGRSHEVLTGIAVLEPIEGKIKVCHERTEVHFKPLTSEQIERYIATGEPMDKAGAYAIQGIGATFVRCIHGDYFNVVGLPVARLSDVLEKDFGIRVL